MHWSTRMWLAVLISGVLSFIIGCPLMMLAPYLSQSFFPERIALIVITVVSWLLSALIGAGSYIYLTHLFGIPRDGETHCRKCHYILRGITQPRCSECGEKI